MLASVEELEMMENGAVFATPIPPRKDLLQQWTKEPFRPVATFDGASYLTINKTQTIGSEYQIIFEGYFIPESPDGTEVLYNGGTSSNNLFVEASGALKFFGNGLVSALAFGTANLGEVNEVCLFMKSDSMKCVLNGVETEYTGLS